MRSFISALTIVALTTSGLGPMLGAARAQTDPDANQRLRDAVARQQEAAGLDVTGPLTDQRYSETELDDLVAPVALYPDALLAQVLVAAANPLQVAQAAQLVEASPDMTDAELDDALAAQEWDPSVLVLLSGFPMVLTRMAEDLDWTERLGGAMIDQDEEVLAAVQRMRERAEAAGSLRSNEAQVVEREGDQIEIRPAKPDVVYVPDYDPERVYVSSRGAPVTTATSAPTGGINTQNALIAGAVGLGTAVLVSEIFGKDDNNKKKSKDDDYWRRNQAIDWNARQVYPRSDRDARSVTWARERDDYWDRSARRWRRDAQGQRRYEAERREALRSIAAEDRRDARERERLREWRAQVKRDAEQDQARKARREEARREQRQDNRKAEEARDDRAAARKAEEERRERVAARKAEDERKERAAARKAEDERKERAAARKAEDERKERAAARKAEDERKERAAERRAEDERKQRAEAQKAEDARKQRAAAQKAEEERQERAAARKANQEQKERATSQKAEARKAANQQQAEPKNAAAPGKREKTEPKSAKSSKKAKKCGKGDKSKDCRPQN